MDTVQLLSASVTPVVLISACGLVALGLYNRLNAILGRIRLFHQQKIELLEELDKGEAFDEVPLLNLIDSQITQVTLKGKAIQKALFCLLSAILAFLSCSLLAAAVVLHQAFGLLALAMHIAGLSLFLAGVGWAIRELTLSITPLEEESAYLETLTAQRMARLGRNSNPKVAKRA